MKVSILIPVYNEARTLGEVLRRVASQPLPLEREIIIVESGSNDGSRQIAEEFTSRMNKQTPHSVMLVLEDVPRGKGHAVREGFKRATGDIILIQDGDLEYDTKDYPALLAPLMDGRSSVVLGSRHTTAESWEVRNFENAPLRAWYMNFGGVLFNAFFNTLYGTKLTDPTTMYKVFRRECLNHFSLTANRFDLDFELLGKLIRAGFAPLEVPVAYESRGFSEGKKIRIFYDPFLWVWVILKTRFLPLK